MGKGFLAERKLADGPDLGVGLQGLLNLSIQGASLDGNDLGGGIGVMGDRGATFRAEDAVDGEARGTLASPALGRTVDGQLVLGDDSDERVGRATLALTVIAVIVGSDQRCVNVHGVRDGFAKAVSGERHGECGCNM